jgi:uncharacterized protein (TIGR03382 family)
MKRALPFLCLLALASAANAATILVDFGAVVTPGTTPTWNNFTVGDLGTAQALVDTTNVSSGVTLTLNGSFSLLDENAAPSGPYPTTVTEDSFFAPGSRSMTLSGLNTSLTYNLTFYAYIARGDSRLTHITVNGNTVSLEPGNGTTTGDSETLSNLVPNASGELVIQYAKDPAVGNLIINALEITSVPEPSSAMVLGAFALAPLLRRRRA